MPNVFADDSFSVSVVAVDRTSTAGESSDTVILSVIGKITLVGGAKYVDA